jgi:peptidoglycan/LPS O-acetylase OafA/YrhL
MREQEPINQKKRTINFVQIREITDFGGRFIDYKMGLAGAAVMSVIVFFVNYYGTHELFGATTAALKQGAYTALFGGIIMRGCEYFATRIQKQTVALVLAIIIPSAISVGLTYGVHSLKGTPKPVASTIPTAMLVIPSTAIWGFLKRRDNFPGQ